MEDDDDLIQLSALQHWLVCPRQCALIHLEHQWQDNRLTAEGNVLHQAVDRTDAESRDGIRRVTGLPLRSARLGLSGRADVVEFRPGPDGTEIPFPVEHKRGREKPDDRDRVQLCAQAMCLEEALGVPVPEGALYYATTRRRQLVPFDDALRRRVEDAAAGIRAMLLSRRTPPPVTVPACKGCSLADLCLPLALSKPSVARYFARGLAES
jgi:CRISPR-associated exonuclease Cas4